MPWWFRSGGILLRRASAPPSPALERALHTIQAVPREYTGGRVAAKERAQGRVPSVVLTPGEGGGSSTRKQLLTTDSEEIRLLLKREPFFCSTVFGLEVRAGPGSTVVLGSGAVLPIKVHRIGETGQILNLVMAWADEGKQLKVDVPVVYMGQRACPGLQKGGYLQKLRSCLTYLCPTEHIPPKIEVDLTNLDVGDRVLMQDVKVHPSLKLLSKNNTMPICKILASKPVEPESKVSLESRESEVAEV